MYHWLRWEDSIVMLSWGHTCNSCNAAEPIDSIQRGTTVLTAVTLAPGQNISGKRCAMR